MRWLSPNLFQLLINQLIRNFRSKLSSKPAAATTSIVPHHIASIADGLSFAYLKEADINSLLTLLQDSTEDISAPVEEKDDQKLGRFGNLVQKQIAVLKEDIAQ